ncbi:MAG: aldose 1-epimerase family protein [Nocardiopsaceae bacterium]|nr:aldose 1-epimerase family protein [Nocardiopsaceae bacterium]
MTTPLTGAQYEIEAGGYRATITELGAGLRSLSRDGRPLIIGYEADELPPHGAGQLLAPWPNRIDGGAYAFGGTRYQLPLSEIARGNAIHGLTRWMPWTLVAREGDEVTLRCAPVGQVGYPFAVQADVTYRLDAQAGLHVTVAAENKGSRPAPWGTGHHPYLAVATTSVDEAELTLPADSWLPADDRGIPSGPPRDVAGTEFDFRVPRKIAGTVLDHAFTGLRPDADGLARVRLDGGGASSVLWADGYRWLQVFTGDPLEPAMRRTALAVEPMTCPPNAFATGDDLVILGPGESVSHRWGIQAG